MPEQVDLIVRHGTVVQAHGRRRLDLAMRDGRFVAIAAPGDLHMVADHEIDARGLHVIPGVIDGHVHFREPGLTHKEDWASGSRAAVMGGVTTVLEMPNTIPPTDTAERARAKLALAASKAWCDFGLFGLVADATIDQLEPMARDGLVVGFKAFLGPTVGDLPEPSAASLVRAMRAVGGGRAATRGPRRGPRQRRGRRAGDAGGRSPGCRGARRQPAAVRRGACHRPCGSLAATTGCPIHVFHLTSAEGLAAVEAWRRQGVDITCELTPHHAFLDSRDVARQGTALRVNPPLRDPGHGNVLLRALAEGRIDLIATDHAPHERERKLADDIWAVASGFAGVETSLALFLTEGVAAGRLTLEQLVRATSEGPARTWGLWPVKGAIALGSDADLTLIDLAREGVIHGAELHGRSDLTPWEGRRTLGAAVATIVRGEVVMRDGELLGTPRGRAVSRRRARPRPLTGAAYSRPCSAATSRPSASSRRYSSALWRMPSARGVTGTSPSDSSPAVSMSSGNGSGLSSKVMLPVASGTTASMAATTSRMCAADAAQVPRVHAGEAAAAGQHHGAADVLGVLVEGASAERDAVGPPQHGRHDGLGRRAGHALVAPWSVDGHRPQRDAGHAVLEPVHPRGALVGLLVDAVQAGRVRGGGGIEMMAAGIRVGGIEHAHRARVDQRCHALGAPPHGLEHVDRADHVDLRAEHRVGSAEGQLRARQVDDVGDLVRVQCLLDGRQLGDVPGHEGHARQLVRREDESQPPWIGGPVEDHHRQPGTHQRAHGPGADAAQRTGDQEAFLAHDPAAWAAVAAAGHVRPGRAIGEPELLQRGGEHAGVAGLLGHPVVRVPDHHRFGEMLVEVVHELQHASLRAAADHDVVERGEVHHQLAQADAAGVRADRHPELVGQQLHREDLVDAGEAAGIDLGEADGVGLEELLPHHPIVDVLAGGDLEGCDGAGDGGVAEDVVRAGGLLDPERVELGQAGHAGDGLGHAPDLVGIDHQEAVGADDLAHDAAAAHVVLEVGADLELDVA